MKKDLDVAFKPETAAEAYLGRLAARGVEYLFANGGTDFAPLVEGYAKGQSLGWRMPEPVIVPHENMGVAMMHGSRVRNFVDDVTSGMPTWKDLWVLPF